MFNHLVVLSVLRSAMPLSSSAATERLLQRPHKFILSDDSHRDDGFIHAGMNKGLHLLEES
jgi:hypothetical protein